jgi:hypothetical protein
MNCIYKIILIFILFTTFITKSYAEDTIRISKPFAPDTIAFKFQNKYIFTHNFFTRNVFENNSKTFITDYLLNEKNNEINFNSCSFTNFSEWSEHKPISSLKRNLLFDSSYFKGFVLNDISGKIAFTSCRSSNFRISDCDSLTIEFNYNNKFNTIIENCTNTELKFVLSGQTDTSTYQVINSTIKKISFEFKDQLGFETYTFINDTINNIYFENCFSDSLKYNLTKYAHNIFFNNCYINNISFPNDQRSPGTEIYFINCKFGKDFILSNLKIDFLGINGCRNITQILDINFSNDSIPALINIENTDVTNLQINWSDNVFLYFKNNENIDIIDNTFENLLDKYQHEGRLISRQKVDIMYRFYSTYRFWYYIEKIGWYFGYKKYLVFFWALGFLFLFSWFNYLKWPEMQKIYSLLPYEKTFYQNKKTLMMRILSAILYTSFIYFSVSIKLDRLKLVRNRYIVAFFIQYLIGLGFLFLIVNAVLKA